jgi:hypothetical protein
MSFVMSTSTTSPFYWQDRRSPDPAHDRVIEFLVMDIQNSPEWATDLLTQIEAVQSGALSHWQRLGNAFSLELSEQGATLEDLVDETGLTHTVSLKELHSAVTAWITHHIEDD